MSEWSHLTSSDITSQCLISDKIIGESIPIFMRAWELARYATTEDGNNRILLCMLTYSIEAAVKKDRIMSSKDVDICIAFEKVTSTKYNSAEALNFCKGKIEDCGLLILYNDPENSERGRYAQQMLKDASVEALSNEIFSITTGFTSPETALAVLENRIHFDNPENIDRLRIQQQKQICNEIREKVELEFEVESYGRFCTNVYNEIVNKISGH